MSLSQDLFELVHSLNKSEKRYVKIYSPQNGDTEYIKLFDKLESMKELKESSLTSTFKHLSPKRLSATKSYLYNHILKGLYSYNSTYNKEAELKTLINHIDILFSKSLYAQCLRFINKAKPIAKKLEFLEEWIELIRMEQRINSFHFRHNDNFPLYTELEEVMQLMVNTSELHKASSQVFRLHLTETIVTEPKLLAQLKELLKLPILKNPDGIKTHSGRMSYYRLMGTYYRMIGEKKLSLESKTKLVELFEEKSEFIEERPINYIEAISNLIIGLLVAWDFDNALLHINKLKTVSKKYKLRGHSKTIEQKIFLTTYSPETAIYLGTCEYEKCVELIPAVEERAQDMNEDKKLVFYHNFSLAHFALEEYDEALKFINRMLNMKGKTRRDIKIGTRMLNLAVHFKMGNREFLDYEIRSTLAFLSKQQIDGWEVLFTNGMRRVNALAADTERREIFAEIKASLEDSLKNPVQKVSRQILHIITWLEAEILGVPFKDIAAKKIEDHRPYLEKID